MAGDVDGKRFDGWYDSRWHLQEDSRGDVKAAREAWRRAFNYGKPKE